MCVHACVRVCIVIRRKSTLLQNAPSYSALNYSTLTSPTLLHPILLQAYAEDIDDHPAEFGMIGGCRLDIIGRRIRIGRPWLNTDQLRTHASVNLKGKELSDMDAYLISAPLGKNEMLEVIVATSNYTKSILNSAPAARTHAAYPANARSALLISR